MIRAIEARWRRCILVCRRCERKLGGGFGAGGKHKLSRLLREIAGGKGRKAKLGVVSCGCLKLCPKHAVTVVDGARPHEWLIVAAGTPIDDVAARLHLDDRAGPAPHRDVADQV